MIKGKVFKGAFILCQGLLWEINELNDFPTCWCNHRHPKLTWWCYQMRHWSSKVNFIWRNYRRENEAWKNCGLNGTPITFTLSSLCVQVFETHLSMNFYSDFSLCNFVIALPLRGKLFNSLFLHLHTESDLEAQRMLMIFSRFPW